MTEQSDQSSTASTYPPTQHLVMEVLAARHRLGEPFWPFPQNCIQALEALAETGLVHIMKRHDVVGWVRVRLTDKGLAEWGLDREYEPAGSGSDSAGGPR